MRASGGGGGAEYLLGTAEHLLNQSSTRAVATLILAAIFVVAGLNKLRHLQLAAEAIKNFRVPMLAHRSGAALLGTAELAIAAAFLTSRATPWPGILSFIASLGYVVVITNALVSGRQFQCACLSVTADRSLSLWTLTRAILMGLVSIYLILKPAVGGARLLEVSGVLPAIGIGGLLWVVDSIIVVHRMGKESSGAHPFKVAKS